MRRWAKQFIGLWFVTPRQKRIRDFYRTYEANLETLENGGLLW